MGGLVVEDVLAAAAAAGASVTESLSWSVVMIY